MHLLVVCVSVNLRPNQRLRQIRTAAAGPHDGDALPRLCPDVDALQHLPIRVIAEPHILRRRHHAQGGGAVRPLDTASWLDCALCGGHLALVYEGGRARPCLPCRRKTMAAHIVRMQPGADRLTTSSQHDSCCPDGRPGTL